MGGRQCGRSCQGLRLRDDDAIVAADEGGMVNGPDAAGDNAEGDGEASDASDSSGGAPEDALGDLSD